ncbi:MAG: Asp-tRNA(Asn)/Glu-tRNA(Gln) amidotransferase subunit GatA [Candidatus Andersenbacteria bacterium]
MASPVLPNTLVAARAALDKQEVSAADLVEEALTTIAQWEPTLHAFLEVFAGHARTAATASDKQRAQGTVLGPLHGVPVAIKDLICTTEGHTTAASKILQNFMAPYDATVITHLKKAGAILIGKTNLDEFAMGSSTEYSAYGPTHNPWQPARVAGGSSGGSAAAVASGSVLAALGTDTGGSIRQPASFCGVVGLKPTYGRVSRFGVIAYGSSLDQVGPFTRTVQDAAIMLSVLAGHDSQDATSSPLPVPAYETFCHGSLKGIKVGVPQEFFAEGVSPEVTTVVKAAIAALADQGATIINLSLPLTPAAIAVYYLIAKAEASTNLARFDALRYAPVSLSSHSLVEHYLEVRGQGFGAEVKRAILMGSYALSAGYYEAWYQQASRVRMLIRREYEEAFKEVDVVVGPVAPETAFTLGSKVDDPLAMYLSDALTVPLSVAGLPALSVPCGFASSLPVGLQIAAPHFKEERLFHVASVYEQAHNWWQQPRL